MPISQKLDNTQVTGPERYRLFQTLTIIFTALGSFAGIVYSFALKGGVVGGLAGLFTGIILMKVFAGNTKNIKRRNVLERTLDSIISMLGAGIFSGLLGGLFWYFTRNDINNALFIALTCAGAGVISTSMAGLAIFFWEAIERKKG